jgi:hypothetical protein
MPLSYYPRRGGSLIYSLGEGTVTDEDVLAHTCLLAEDELIDMDGRELVDLRGVSRVRLSRKGLTSIISHDKLYGDRYADWRCAIVADRALLYGWGKTFTTLRRMLKAPADMEVFRTIGEACAWLGIDEKDILPSGPQAA